MSDMTNAQAALLAASAVVAANVRGDNSGTAYWTTKAIESAASMKRWLDSVSRDNAQG